MIESVRFQSPIGKLSILAVKEGVVRIFSKNELACPPKVVPSVKLVFVQTERNKEYDT